MPNLATGPLGGPSDGAPTSSNNNRINSNALLQLKISNREEERDERERSVDVNDSMNISVPMINTIAVSTETALSCRTKYHYQC